MLDQKITTGNESSLFSTQINSLALQRNQKEEANAARDTALNERIESLEQKIQLILQDNIRIEALLNNTRKLYELKEKNNEFKKKTLLEEITPLSSEVQRLTESVAAISQTNLTLSNQVPPTIAHRDYWYRDWYQAGFAAGLW